jgi:uncharacterized membrane protein YgcG
MKKATSLRLFSIVFLLSLFIGAAAQTRYTVNEVPNVQRQDYQQFVSDPENAIPYEDIHTLNAQMQEIKDSLHIQCAVVVLPAIDSAYASAKDFATELFKAWGIGNNDSNQGLLILLTTADGEREIAFETGYGLEDKLPDGMCKLIQTTKMLPYFKEGDFGAGLIAGVTEVEKVLKGNSDLVADEGWPKAATWFIVIWIVVGLLAIWLKTRSAKPKEQDGSSNYMAAINSEGFMGVGCLLAILFLPAFILFAIFKGFSGKSKGGANSVICESCKEVGGVKLMGQPSIRQTAIPGQDGMKEYSFKCSKCGHVHTELVPYVYVEKTSSSSSNSSRKSTGSSSGGGTRGGSWGGGSSGGGGASTKF